MSNKEIRVVISIIENGFTVYDSFYEEEIYCKTYEETEKLALKSMKRWRNETK